MDTTLNPKQTDPPHVLVARAHDEFAHAHERIARAGEEIARAEEQLSKLEHDAARHPSDHPQTRMNTFRPAVPGNRPLLDRPAVRGFTGLLLAACIGVAAIAWQSPYGDAGKQIIARWAPQLVVTSSLPLENLGLPAQPSPPTVQAAAAQTAPPQPAPPAQTAPEDVAPTAAALSPELTQLLQSMARDLATLGQGIELLKSQPGTNGPRQCERRRAAQGEPGTNGPHHCQGFRGQGFRAEPAAQDISASATADCHPDAQARAGALTIPGVGHLTALALTAASTLPSCAGASSGTIRNSSRKSGLGTSKAAGGAASIITPRCASRPTDF